MPSETIRKIGGESVPAEKLTVKDLIAQLQSCQPDSYISFKGQAVEVDMATKNQLDVVLR